MKEFDTVKDLVYCEIDEISHIGKLDMNTVKVLGELVDILKDIGSVEMFEEGVGYGEEEYSNGYNRNGGYSQRWYPGNSYDNMSNGNSYRSGRSNYPRRGGYSRTDSKQYMVDELTRLMNEAQNNEDRESIKRLVDQMQNK